jgi:hypothetical protein
MREPEVYARGQLFLKCNPTERGRGRRMILLAKYFLHMKLQITREPGLIPWVKYCQHIMPWITEEPGLMPLVK